MLGNMGSILTLKAVSEKQGSGKVLTDEPVTPVGPWADIQRIALKTLAFAGFVPTATAVGVECISQM
jgi:hypothetical protein